MAQITEDGELAALSGSNQYSVSDKVIRGGVKIQKRDLETKDTKAQGGATLKDTAFEIISLNDNAVLVDGKLYSKNEVVKTIHTGVDGIAATATDTLPYGKYRIEESNAPEGYLTDGAKPIEFEITEDGKIVDLTDETHSIYNQIKRGDLEGVKIGDGTHKRLANVPFRITSKTTGESHIIVTDANGQFSTSSDWVSHKQNTNAGKTSEDGIWFGTSTPDDSKGALLYDTYTIEELRCVSNKGMTLIPAFDVVVSRNNVVIDLGTLTDDYEPEISIPGFIARLGFGLAAADGFCRIAKFWQLLQQPELIGQFWVFGPQFGRQGADQQPASNRAQGRIGPQHAVVAKYAHHGFLETQFRQRGFCQ